jgi:beta-galactosidase
VGNEVENQGSEEMLDLLRMLADEVRSLDPTRPVTYALEPHCNPRELWEAPLAEKVERTMRMAELVDLLSCNYQEQWYEAYRQAKPDALIIGSECYAFFRGKDNRFLAYEPYNGWFDVEKHDYVMGQFLWPGIDYLGESHPWPSKGRSEGMIDLCGFRKPRSYFHQSVWSSEPMVHIAVFDDSLPMHEEKPHWSWPKLASHWTFPHFERQAVRLVTFTNCEETELWVNGASFGRKRLADFPDRLVVWYVPYQAGVVKAVGYRDGQPVCEHELRTAGTPAEIRLVPDTRGSCNELAHVEACVADSSGTVIPYATNMLTITLEGDGRIIGIDNGDLSSSEPYCGDWRSAYFGRVLVVVRKGSGPLSLRAESPGLATAEFRLVEDSDGGER